MERLEHFRQQVLASGADVYLKWLATAMVIFGAVLTSANIAPLNIWVFNVGNLSWMIVGLLWLEWSLVALNGILVLIYVIGLLLWQ